MGFFEGLGHFMGSMSGMLEQRQEQINMYRSEYECLSNNELKKEFRRWHGKSDTEARVRIIAIKTILQERGVM